MKSTATGATSNIYSKIYFCTKDCFVRREGVACVCGCGGMWYGRLSQPLTQQQSGELGGALQSQPILMLSRTQDRNRHEHTSKKTHKTQHTGTHKNTWHTHTKTHRRQCVFVLCVTWVHPPLQISNNRQGYLPTNTIPLHIDWQQCSRHTDIHAVSEKNALFTKWSTHTHTPIKMQTVLHVHLPLNCSNTNISRWSSTHFSAVCSSATFVLGSSCRKKCLWKTFSKNRKSAQWNLPQTKLASSQKTWVLCQQIEKQCSPTPSSHTLSLKVKWSHTTFSAGHRLELTLSLKYIWWKFLCGRFPPPTVLITLMNTFQFINTPINSWIYSYSFATMNKLYDTATWQSKVTAIILWFAPNR